MAVMFSFAFAYTIVEPIPGIGTQAELVLTATAASVLFLGYLYSPIPAHNGGWGHPSAKPQVWGFSTEPQENYIDNPEDRWSIPLHPPIMVAEKGDDTDE